MTDLKIEKNVPLDTPHTGRRAAKYPHLHELLQKMGVGDSIVFPLDNPKQRVQYNKEASYFFRVGAPLASNFLLRVMLLIY